MYFGPYTTAGTIQHTLWVALGREIPENLHLSPLEGLLHFTVRAYRFIMNWTDGYPQICYVKHTAGTREYNLEDTTNITILPTGFAKVKQVQSLAWQDSSTKWYELTEKTTHDLDMFYPANDIGDPYYVAYVENIATLGPAPNATDTSSPTRLKGLFDLLPTVPTSANEATLEPPFSEDYHDLISDVAEEMIVAKAAGKPFEPSGMTLKRIRQLRGVLNTLRSQPLTPGNAVRPSIEGSKFQRDYFKG